MAVLMLDTETGSQAGSGILLGFDFGGDYFIVGYGRLVCQFLVDGGKRALWG